MESSSSGEAPKPRTVLEQQIRDVRRMTLQEFADYADGFARQHGEPGTLSLRHLERLVSGRGPGGQPLGKVRPATRRLLERIFELPIAELLSPPDADRQETASADELRDRLGSAARVDDEVIRLLHEQLWTIRRLDRQLGVVVAHQETVVKAEQVDGLLRHSLQPSRREALAKLLSEVCTLAGWQSLDAGRVSEAWRYYDQAISAARESGDPGYEVHARAEQATVLVDVGRARDAVALLGDLRTRAVPAGLRAWLAATHGEALAAAQDEIECRRAFDEAETALHEVEVNEGPYVALDEVHLARWRGHALARLGDSGAAEVLVAALGQLDPTFIRAEASLRVDLASALQRQRQHSSAEQYASRARMLASEIGSVRQQKRLYRQA
ncbi:tetratricopeptide (TPR) repeat protein [Prauserella isguenensis]|uniref:Tetratricopeptide (TPR) repeat protein n=1 Tax=Prauserella isguenensis TaxID=1470180 RepID=A0A839S8T7_9PSEU|nr:hypothetical protein [Prauserella isguenensis]MBB3053099.1 tetratricopeptide (TPR) repeat protein [Prauserella isguenensis]